jgi:tetratricopeptide (TPR) repeat protein
MEPAKLSRLMRGELDWVVMRCLEKDRSRRYDTASGLARDVERYLKDEPVEARPPSTWYRVRKMVRRNRMALTLAGVVAAVVVLGAAVTLWQASLAAAARRDAIVAADTLKTQEAERIAERRQEKLDRAIEAALGGDPVKADKLIVAAEAAGVAADQSHWLRGLVHYQQAKFEDAIREFERALAVRPTSVAAQAMHAHALFLAVKHNGELAVDQSRSEMAQLASMTPETAEDYLCRGFVAFWLVGKGQTFADFDKAFAMRDTPMAHAFRAGVEGVFAAQEGDLPLAERALDDIRQAKRWLSDSKFVRFVSLTVHLNAADLYTEAHQSQKQKAALEEAGRDAAALEGVPSMVYVLTRTSYFGRVGDGEAVVRELAQASSRPEMSELGGTYAWALYEQGRDVEARRVLDKQWPSGGRMGRVLRIILWIEQAGFGTDKAYDRYREWAAKREADGLQPDLNEITILMLLGKKKEAADLWDLMHNLPPGTTASASEATILQNAGTSRRDLVRAHYLVGLGRLSDGDRAGACEHFRMVFNTKHDLGDVAYPFAQMCLARLERDKTWPKWIPVKKN